MQGVRTHTPLRWPAVFSYNWYSATTTTKTMWFIGVEVEQDTSAPPPKKNPGSAPEYYHSHSYCAYVENLFENQIFLHFLSTTQE